MPSIRGSLPSPRGKLAARRGPEKWATLATPATNTPRGFGERLLPHGPLLPGTLRWVPWGRRWTGRTVGERGLWSSLSVSVNSVV